MAQSITTLLEKTEITAADIAADTSVINYMYLVHGTGSKRSRKIKLEELKKAIGQQLFDRLIVGDGTDYVQIGDTKIKFNKSSNSFEISLTTETVGDVSIPVMYVNKKIWAGLGFKGNLVGDVTGDLTGDVTGDVTGNLTGESHGTHVGDVSTNSILPRNNQTIHIGNSTRGAQFDGTLVVGRSVAGSFQSTFLVVDSGILKPSPLYPIDMKAGPVIIINSVESSSTAWYITGLPEVIPGQRITIVNADTTNDLKIFYGRTSKVAVIPPQSACEFVCTEASGTGAAWVDKWAVLGGCEIEALT